MGCPRIWLHNPLRTALFRYGQTVTVNNWEPPTVRLSDETLESVFYLYPSEQSARNGEKAGGSGFFILIPFEREGVKRNHLYMATNRHVIDGGALTARINDGPDSFVIFDTDDRAWFRHPDGHDLALILVDFSITFTCKGLSLGLNNDLRKTIAEHDLGIGDEVFTVGRFVNHEGKQRNNPVVRFGNVAQMPLEPIRQDDGYMQESFLVECKSIAGYSGSPVFAFIKPFSPRPKTAQITSKAFGPWLLGVTWGHITEWKPVCDSKGRPLANPAQIVAMNSGMMGVVPAWRLMEMFNHQKTKQKRLDAETRIIGDGPPVSSSDAAIEPAKKAARGNDNPSHREDFTSLLSAAAKARRADD